MASTTAEKQAGVYAVFQGLGQSFVSDMEEGNEERSRGSNFAGLVYPILEVTLPVPNTILSDFHEVISDYG